MKIGNSSDIYEDSGLSPLLYDLNIGRAFVKRDYGNNEIEIFFVICCLKENVKNRIRLDKKDKVLYWDIILNYETITKSSINEKKRILANSIINSFDILDRYKELNLNKELIKEDAKKYLIELDWI